VKFCTYMTHFCFDGQKSFLDVGHLKMELVIFGHCVLRGHQNIAGF
jgi:hypothetical protein